MKASSLPYLWTAIFGALASVPLFFAGLLFTLTSLIPGSTRAITMLIILGSISLIAFLFSAVFFHALLLSVIALDSKARLTMLGAFKKMRETYWRVFLHDILAAALALPAAAVFIWGVLNQQVAWLVLGAVLALIHIAALLPSALRLSRMGAWEAIKTSAQDLTKEPLFRMTSLGGMILWSLLPLLLWAIGTATTLTNMADVAAFMQVLANWLSLLIGVHHIFWLYLASPADVLLRAGLLLVNIGYAVIATTWLASSIIRRRARV